MITYEGNQITMFSEGEKKDYINLTEMAKAWKYRKSIVKWLKNRQTLDFLCAWEKKHNPLFDGTQMVTVFKKLKISHFVSVQDWVGITKAKGIYTELGINGGTYAHKDIAIRFGGWLSPDFELFLVEEIQRLKKIEEQKNSYELIDRNTLLWLIELKEVFKYVVNQKAAEEAHKDYFVAQSGSKNPFADFNVWRNKILDFTEAVINKRIEQYCIDNGIALTKRMIKKSKHEKLLILDSYEAVRNAVWDFLNIEGEVNALNLANLVKDIIRTEKGEIVRNNETNLFQQKQTGFVEEFPKYLSEHPKVTKAREVLAIRQEQKKKQLSSPMNKVLKGLMAVPPPKDEIGENI